MFPKKHYLLMLFPDFEKVLVIGGSSDDGILDDVEVLNLGSQPGNCDPLPDLPVPLESSTSPLLEGGGTVKVCGGNDGGNPYYTSLCYDYKAGSGAWTESEPMMAERRYHGSSVIGGKWFITGGDVS